MNTRPGKITLWGVEVFVATAEEQSISAAARRLGTSPATVSQQLTNLEGNIGTVLLDRTARPVMLTPAGTLFLRRANAILNEADQARAELGRAGLSDRARVRLGMIEDFEADVTPALLSSMAGDLSGSQFLLETGASHRLLDLLEARALDVVVAAEMDTPLAGMERHALMEEPFVVAMPPGAAGGQDLARRLTRLPLIQYTTRHHMGRQIAAHLGRRNLVLPHRFEIDSYHAILALVAEGQGWTILTPLGLRRAQRFRDRIDVAPLPWAPLSRRIALSARRDLLGPMPGEMADRLKGLISSQVVAPVVADLPWLEGQIRTL